jgi:5-methylcytosine-specific restriction enzyme A
MPTAPLKPCTTPRCPNRTARGGACPEHRRQADRTTKGAQPWRAYGGAWPHIRRGHLLDHPLCARCGQLATEVDHITPLRLGGTHAADNLQSLCKPCHSSKTARENGWGGPTLA